MELTRRRGKRGRYGRTSIYSWHGTSYRIYDSAIQVLRMLEFLKDPSFDPVTKCDLVVQMLSPDDLLRAEDLQGLLNYVLWEIAGIDMDGSHEVEAGEKDFDWEQDSSIIKTSLYQTYGKPWDVLTQEVTFKDLVSMMGFVPQKTPLGQALYYRLSDPPERTEYNEEYVKHWHEMHEYWALDVSPEAHAEAMNNIANDIFAAYKVAAQNG